jgi:15-cis-phytoene synthase
VSAVTAIEEAYERCEAVTREQAANFYYGIRLLSGERRRAMCAVYAFARRVDDIGDGELPAERKLEELRSQDAALAELVAGAAAAEDPVMLALSDACGRFPLPLDALGDLTEGVRMDVEGRRYETFEQLVPYCRRVAGAVGRVCLAIFGLRERCRGELTSAYQLADDLGVALQLTNILRDVREDAGNGRVYLPLEDLGRFGLPQQPAALLGVLPGAAVSARRSSTAPARATEAASNDALERLVAFEAARAREWFERGIALTSMLDRRSAACVLAMAGIYRRLLEQIDAAPLSAMSARMSLPTHEKAWVAARSLLGVGA